MESDFFEKYRTKEEAYHAGFDAGYEGGYISGAEITEEGSYFDGLSDLTKYFSERGVDYKFDMIGDTEFILLPAQVLRVKGGDDRGAIYFSPLEEYEGFKKHMLNN